MSHALMPEHRATNSSATYGELITTTEERSSLAITHTSRLLDPDAIADELLGYQRFLLVAGSHLALLEELSGSSGPGVERLRRRLVSLPVRDIQPGAWAQAAAALGAAHDLVSTHVTAHAARTPEATEVVAGPASLAASRDVVRLILDAELGSQAVLDRLRRARKSMNPSKALTREVARVRAINSTIDTTSKAASWELGRAPKHEGLPTLDELYAAATPLGLRAGATTFEQQLCALRLLRQLAMRQSEGRLPASPASLRDLTVLAARVTDPAQSLPEPRTALDRVRLAHARDRLDVAHAAWAAAGRELTGSIQGVSKAPALFRVAVAGILDAQEPSLALRIAVSATLPRLAADATTTVSTMTADGSLLTHQQQAFAQTRKTWRRITHEEGAYLAGRFKDAGTASVAIARALGDLQPTLTRPDGGRPIEAVVEARRLVGPNRGFIR